MVAGGVPPFAPVLDLTVAPQPQSVWNSTDSDEQLCTGVGYITTVKAVEDSGSAAFRMALYDATSAAGEVLMYLGGTSGTSDGADPGIPGIPFLRGIYCHFIAGHALVSVTYIPFLQPVNT